MALSSGDDWTTRPGATVVLRNSTFESNTADLGNAGVVSLDKFTTLVVAGEGNVFEGNVCGEDGAVFAGTTDSHIVVEGGEFKDNVADSVGVSCVSFVKTHPSMGFRMRLRRDKRYVSRLYPVPTVEWYVRSIC